jgi:hypothetical protein
VRLAAACLLLALAACGGGSSTGKNAGDTTHDITVTVRFIDADGVRVDLASDSVSDLELGESAHGCGPSEVWCRETVVIVGELPGCGDHNAAANATEAWVGALAASAPKGVEVSAERTGRGRSRPRCRSTIR